MIESAARLQSIYGVPATTFAAVLADSGASRGAIYHHFPGGRDELAALATEHGGLLVALELERLLADRDPLTALTEFVERTSLVALRQDFKVGCALAAGALDPAGDSTAREAAAAGFLRCQEILADALSADFDARQAAGLAVMSMAAIVGALVLVRAERSLRPLERVADELRTVLVPDRSSGR